MFEMFEDEGDIFMGTPESKLMDIMFNANNDVVRFDLTNFIRRRAAMELVLNEQLDDEFDKKIDIYMVENRDNVEKKMKSLCIELMGEIVSKSE
jgi:hypothetical protein